MSQAWTVSLADIEIPCQFRFPETHQYFSAVPCENGADICNPVLIREDEWNEYLHGMPANAHTEYSVLTATFGDALLAHDRAIFHGVALRRRGQAWLICGRSGVGKSTQARFLQELRPGEFGVICGDRPFLSFHDNEIMAHPSPWNGKENWHGAEAAPLAGMILLQRGEQNRVEPLRPAVAALPVFQYLIQTFREEKTILAAAQLVDRLLRTVPVWCMQTHEVPASTELLLETLFM